mgnify:CR=1 FL=1
MENAKLEEEETVKDRTPILDLLIDKIKYFNFEKKKLLERYERNALTLKESLDQMMEFLGIGDYAGIPFVLEKMEDQMAEIRRLLDSGSVENIKHYLNNLNNTQTKLINEIRDLNIAYTKLRNAVK